MTTRHRFILTLEHVGKGDTFMALRMALKVLLRTYNFRCVAMRPDNADAAGDGTDAATDGAQVVGPSDEGGRGAMGAGRGSVTSFPCDIESDEQR